MISRFAVSSSTLTDASARFYTNYFLGDLYSASRGERGGMVKRLHYTANSVGMTAINETIIDELQGRGDSGKKGRSTFAQQTRRGELPVGPHGQFHSKHRRIPLKI